MPEGVEQHRSITKFSHPEYDSSTINNDVCLLKVDEPFEFNDEVKPIAFDTNLEWAADSSFMVSGWGTKSVSLCNSVCLHNSKEKIIAKSWRFA